MSTMVVKLLFTGTVETNARNRNTAESQALIAPKRTEDTDRNLETGTSDMISTGKVSAGTQAPNAISRTNGEILAPATKTVLRDTVKTISTADQTLSATSRTNGEIPVAFSANSCMREGDATLLEKRAEFAAK